MQSFKAAWDERETEISWENTGGKNCFHWKRHDEDAKQFPYGFSFTLHRYMLGASFPIPQSSGVSSFQEGQNWGQVSCTGGHGQLGFWEGEETLGSPGLPLLPFLLQPLWGLGLGVPQCAKRPTEGLGPEPLSLLLRDKCTCFLSVKCSGGSAGSAETYPSVRGICRSKRLGANEG